MMSFNIVIVLLLLLSLFLGAVYRFLPIPFAVFLQNLLRKVSGVSLRHIDVKGVVWPYLEAGSRKNPTVVLLHGFGADKDNWPLYARLLRDDFHLICPDLPGFGDNTDDPSLNYHTAVQADRLRDFLSQLNIDKCHLGGNSMGGMIALRFALRYPQCLFSLTLFDCAGVSSENTSQLEKSMDKGENLLNVSTLSDVDKIFSLAAYKPLKLPLPLKKLFFHKAKARESLHNKIFSGLSIERKTPLDSQLRDIETPVLIIWGKNDQLLDVSCTKILQKELPNNQCVILEETGHIPMIERPKETASIQRKFLTKLLDHPIPNHS